MASADRTLFSQNEPIVSGAAGLGRRGRRAQVSRASYEVPWAEQRATALPAVLMLHAHRALRPQHLPFLP